MHTSCSTARRTSDPPPQDVNWQPDTQRSTRVNLDTLTKDEVAAWRPGQTLL